MRDFVEVQVPYDLLPDITREILQFAADPNYVEVVHVGVGRVIHVHPDVAAAWWEFRQQKPEPVSEPTAEQLPEPTPNLATESESAPAPQKRTTPSA